LLLIFFLSLLLVFGPVFHLLLAFTRWPAGAGSKACDEYVLEGSEPRVSRAFLWRQGRMSLEESCLASRFGQEHSADRGMSCIWRFCNRTSVLF
jgi:hypothetical protein